MKPYWRIKKNGKWTWVAMTKEQREVIARFEKDFPLKEEE